jgi:hypothetical protein
VEDFPAPDWPGWFSLGNAYQKGKFACNDIEQIPEQLRSVIYQLSALEFLESVTGIRS